MRKLLRSSDLSVPGSRQHKVWTSYLHTLTAWAERKASWFARLPASQNATTYLDGLEERYRTTLQAVLDGWEANEFAEMVIIGHICFSTISLFEKGVEISAAPGNNFPLATLPELILYGYR